VTNRSDFLRNLKGQQVKLHPLQLEGWDVTVYLRPQTLGEIRDVLLKSDEKEKVGQGITVDPLFIARNIARMVRDEYGELLFNADDNAQMEELMSSLEGTAPSVSKQISTAYNKLNEPNSEEADAKGN